MALIDFQDWLRTKVNKAMYVWGAQGEIITSKEQIKKLEVSNDNANKAITRYLELCNELNTNKIEAYDCSGLGMCWLENLTKTEKNDATASTMYLTMCEPINREDLKSGDWCFRKNAGGKIHHIGYIVDSDLGVIESRGRSYGVVYTKNGVDEMNGNYWNLFGRPKIFKDEILKLTPVVNVPDTTAFKLLKTGSKGQEVLKYQCILTALGFACGDLDGIYGKDTVSAVTSFQKSYNLTSDGIIGKNTAFKLSEFDLAFKKNIFLTSPYMKGENIKWCQRLLNARLFDCTADGVFGQNTRLKVIQFQKSVGLSADGIIGPNTYNKLFGL